MTYKCVTVSLSNGHHDKLAFVPRRRGCRGWSLGAFGKRALQASLLITSFLSPLAPSPSPVFSLVARCFVLQGAWFDRLTMTYKCVTVSLSNGHHDKLAFVPRWRGYRGWFFPYRPSPLAHRLSFHSLLVAHCLKNRALSLIILSLVGNGRDRSLQSFLCSADIYVRYQRV